MIRSLAHFILSLWGSIPIAHSLLTPLLTNQPSDATDNGAISSPRTPASQPDSSATRLHHFEGGRAEGGLAELSQRKLSPFVMQSDVSSAHHARTTRPLILSNQSRTVEVMFTFSFAAGFATPTRAQVSKKNQGKFASSSLRRTPFDGSLRPHNAEGGLFPDDRSRGA